MFKSLGTLVQEGGTWVLMKSLFGTFDGTSRRICADSCKIRDIQMKLLATRRANWPLTIHGNLFQFIRDATWLLTANASANFPNVKPDVSFVMLRKSTTQSYARLSTGNEHYPGCNFSLENTRWEKTFAYPSRASWDLVITKITQSREKPRILISSCSLILFTQSTNGIYRR